MAVTRIKNNQITDATIVASAKLEDYTITATKIANNLTYGSDLTVSGNLTVQGNVTAIETVDLVVEDPLIVLAKDQTGAPSLDIGFIGRRGTDTNIAFVWDESSERFITAYTDTLISNTTITINSYASFQTLDLTANNANFGGTLDVIGNTTVANFAIGNAKVIDMGLNLVGNVLDPSANTDAATKGYVDGLVFTGFDVEDDTANVTKISGGDTLFLLGTANEVTATITAIDTVTFGLPDDVVITANLTAGNVYTAGVVSATGNITGGNLISNAAISASTTIDATGNITGGNITTAGIANIGNLEVTGTSSLTGNVITPLNVTGNIATGNLYSVGKIDAAGNITGGNLTTAGTANIGTLEVTGTGSITSDLTAGNVYTAGVVSAIGNITGGNLVSNAAINATTTIDAIGNITGGNLTTAGTANIGTLEVTGTGSITGNLTAGNIGTAGLITATGNITGGNLISNAAISGTTLDITTDAIVGNLYTQGVVNALGNITGGNVLSNGIIYSQTLETIGNALIGGNLTVAGNITYQNVDDLRIEDPVIIMGTGPNGAPLSGPDVMDRGIYMEYYTSGLGNAFVGWQNSTGNMIIANDVQFSGNNIVAINAYGNMQAGNAYLESALVTGNITAGNISSLGNLSLGNLHLTGSATIDKTLDVLQSATVGNLYTQGVVSAIGNITGGNLVSNAAINATTTIDAIGNITGGNLTTAGTANIGNLEVTGTGSITGNLTAGNIGTVGLITATGNITGGNITTAGIANIGNLEVTGTSSLIGNVISPLHVTGNITAGNILSIGALGANNLVIINDISANNISAFNASNADRFYANTKVQTPLVTQAGGNLEVSTTGSGDIIINPAGELYLPTQLANSVLFTNSANAVTTDGNLSYNGAALELLAGNINVGATVANIAITNQGIQGYSTEVLVNEDGADVNFRVSGNTQANLFIVDAGSNSVLIGNGTPITNVALLIDGTTSIKVPVGTTGERPSTPVTGMVRFNTSLDNLEFYDNNSWTTAGSQFTVIAANTQSGDGSTVAFTLPQTGTTAGTIVAINGVMQIPVTAYSVLGNVCTFTEAPESTDVIDFRQLTTTSEVSAVAGSPGQVFEANPTKVQFDVTGNLIPTANLTYSLGNATNYWKSLYVGGNSTIYLGNIQLKEVGGQMAFYAADGTTPATIAASSVDTTTIANGTSSMAVISSGGNVRANVGGSTVGVFSSTGLTVTGSISATNGFIGLDATKIANGTSEVAVASSNGNINANVAGQNLMNISANGVTVGATATAWFASSSTTRAGRELTAVANIAGPAETVMVNQSSDALAYSEFIAINDAGNVDTGWVSIGINSSTYNDAGFPITQADDGYVLYQAPAGTTAGGNLVVATGDQGTDNAIVFAAGGFATGNTQMTIFPDQKVEIIIDTVSTTPTTGALVVDGGAGVVGNLNVGGNINASETSTITANNIQAGVHIFSGDVDAWLTSNGETDTGRRIIGVASLNGPAETVIVNESSAALAYSEFIAINDVGNISQGWTSMGINSSNYNDPAFPVTQEDDGYLLYHPPTGTTGRGALVIGTGEGGTDNSIIFAAGGFATGNTQMTIYADQKVAISIPTQSTSTGTGALTVTGGIGLLGNLNVGGDVNIVGNITLGGSGNTIDVSALAVDDPLIYVGGNNPGDALDLGIIGQYKVGNANVYYGSVRDASDGTYRIFGNLTTKPTSTVNFSAAGLDYLPIIAGAANLTNTTTSTNVTSGALIVAGGAGIGGALHVGTTIQATGNITGGNVSTSGNITAGYFLGNGSQLTGIDATAIQSGTANVRTFLNGNVTISAAGTANVVVVTSTGVNIAGTLSTSTGNISGGNLSVSTGLVTLGGIVNANANGVGNIGSSTGYFNTVFAKATSAQYADLAEMYEADQHIEPGTVVTFGGSKEVTVCQEDANRRIAGVVSTNPSYIMNSGLEGEYVVAVALTGRVPCRVTGAVRKGDMMVATADGRARAEADPKLGSVIGKALADFDGVDGVIEVVVGRQ